MPAVPIGPQHLSGNALFPPPFEIPSNIPIKLFKKVETTSRRFLATNGLPDADMIELFNDTSDVLMGLVPYKETVAAHQHIFNFFLNFCNKFRQYWIKCGTGSYPVPCQKVVNFLEELTKLRARAKHAATEQRSRDRDERIAASLEAAPAPKTRKGKKAITTPAVVPDTDDESVIFGASEDEDMEDAGPLEVSTKDNNAIDIDAPAPSEVSSTSSSTNVKGKDLPSFKKNKEDRAEAAMKVISKTEPEEAAKVASEPSTSSRKRRRASSFYEFAESHEDQQGLSAKQLSKLTPRFIDSAISTARTIVTSAQPEPSDDAIALQDLQVRTDLAVATHRIAKQLKMRDELYAEHVRLIGVMKERKLAAPEGGPVFT
ncbi:hypothetical protein DFH09DRAFT_1346741 [Mycena vulgaris]|nr:hypothetical protein DFH09DRAFT_1346741 [Mycena vulgaris]